MDICLSKNKIVLPSLVWAAWCLVAFIPVPGHAGEKKGSSNSGFIQIKVDAAAEVSGTIVYLSDLVEIIGKVSAYRRRLKVKICLAPRPGRTMKISGKRIKRIIESMHLLPKRTKIVIPEYVSVKRSYQRVSEKLFKDSFNDYLTSRMDGKRFSVRDFKIRGGKNFPKGKLDLRFPENDSTKTRGRVSAAALVFVNGREEGRVYASAWVDLFEKVVCAGQRLEKGAVLSSSDIIIKKMNISRKGNNFFTSSIDVTGKRIKRNMEKGCLLSPGMLEELPLVNKGDMVKLIARTETLTVETLGRARSKGFMGQIIKVKNMESGQVVSGRIKNKYMVEIDVF